MKVKQISVATKPRGRPPRTKILIDTEQKKKRVKEQKKIEEQKREEEKKKIAEKKCEEEKKKLDEKKREEEKKIIEEQKYEEEKKRFEEALKRFLEEKTAEEEKKREKKKLEEEKQLEEKKNNEKKKLEQKKKDDEKKREQKKKEDDEKKREEKKKQTLQSSWGKTYGQDNYTRGRSRNLDHSRSEFDRRERSRDYGMRRDNPSCSSSRFRSTELLFQPLSHELEIQQLHAKVRELQHIVAEGKLLQGSKEPLSKQSTGPYPVKSSYEETDLFKLKNRLKYYQKNNSDLKQKLDYANKKIAQMQREQSAYYSNYQNQTDYSQQMQNSSYLNHHHNQQEFYY